MLKTLNLGIAVLKMFTKEKPVWGGRELATAMNINHTNIYRILETFEKNGFIKKNPDTKKYSLGIAIWELGMNMYDSQNIDQLCLPILDQLKDTTGETAVLTILSGCEAITLLKSEPENKVKFLVTRGSRSPLYVGASYRAMLAFLDDSTIHSILNDELESYTPFTKTNKEEILNILEEIRVNGYSVSYGEYTPDVIAVAVPLFNSNNEVIASITVSGPKFRFTKEKVTEALEPIFSAKVELEKIINRYQLDFH